MVGRHGTAKLDRGTAKLDRDTVEPGHGTAGENGLIRQHACDSVCSLNRESYYEATDEISS